MTSDNFFIIFYSFIQGITEYLPISSSAHLNLLEIYFKNNNSRNLLFETTAHVSTLFALIFFLLLKDRKKISLKTKFKRFFLPTTLSSIPVVMIGGLIVIFDLLKTSILVIAISSILGAILLFVADKIKKPLIKQPSLKTIFLITGCFQVLALIPGFSRAGSVITGLRFLGVSLKESIEYSFWMGIPIITLSLFSNFFSEQNINFGLSELMIFILTFIFAFLAIKILYNTIEKIGLMPFIIYRIILGIVLLLIYV